MALIPVLESRPKFVVYAPLADTPLPPDVVLVFAESRQGLVITETVQQIDGSVPPALGRPPARLSCRPSANDVLLKFHELRGLDVRAGPRPTYQDSLARLQGVKTPRLLELRRTDGRAA